MHRIPGPDPLESLRFLRDPYAAHERWRVRYGDLFRLPFPLGPSIVLARPDAIRAVLALEPDTTDVWMKDALVPVFGAHSIFTASGETHTHHRRAIVRLLTPLPSLGRLVRDEIAALPPRLDLASFGRSVAAASIVSVLFGANIPSIARHLASYSALAASPALVAALAIPALRGRYWPVWSRFCRERRAMHDLVDTHPRSQAIDRLSAVLSPEEVRDDLVTLLLAGYDTTASAINWALCTLFEHPSALDALQDEIDGFSGDLDDDVAICAQPRLAATVLEVLRYRTVVLQTNRTLRAPQSLLGYELPEGTTLSLGAHLVHRDARFYKEPERFLPERFLGHTPDPLSFLAFGVGARRCPGAQMAQTEIALALFHLLRGHTLQPLYRGPVRGHVEGMVLVPGSLFCTVSARNEQKHSP